MLTWLITHTPLLYLTQSLWRDEVFSIFMSSRPISFFVSRLSFEPPFYYLLLHFWMQLFGTSEIAARSLSLVAFAGATIIVIFWAEKLFVKHWLSVWLPIFFFFNPMLLYYAFEVRTYGWYIFFATLSLWAYSEKKWFWWTLATVLGFYTHSYMIIVPFAQTVHYLVTEKKHLFKQGLRSFASDHMVRSLMVAGLIIAPWILRLASEMGKLKQSWYFPVDMNLVLSVLGNLFVGYEGTPWYLWSFTKFLSVIILGFIYLALSAKKDRKQTTIFVAQIFLPLIIIIGISFIKPLYVNRYVIPVTIAEIFLIAIAIYNIRNHALQKIVAAICLLFVLGFNMWYPNKHKKLDIRTTIAQIHSIKTPEDVILAESPLIFFESIYYATDRDRVYLYNPYNNQFPWYVGDSIVSPSQMVQDYPPYPIRAFLVHENGTFDVIFQTTPPITKK